MNSIDNQAVEESAPTEAGNSQEACLRQLWKTALLAQERLDAGRQEDAQGQALGKRLARLCRELLESGNLKFARSLILRGASLHSQRKEQHLFPAKILKQCFFKTRSGTLRPHQNPGEEVASYSKADSDGSQAGAKRFVEDFSAHLATLEESLAAAPVGKENSEAVRELALYVLTHASSVFQEDVHRLAREYKPFEVAARAVLLAFGEGGEGGSASQSAGAKRNLPCSSVLRAYCASVLNRLESIERLGAVKSAKIFNKYLIRQSNSKISLEKILGQHSPDSFPDLHHLPAGEFAALTADAASDREGEFFLALLSQISRETALRSRELLRLSALSVLRSGRGFQIKKEEEDMEPVKRRAATRSLLIAYRQVRTHLKELGILGQRGQYSFGWYSIPRIFEALFMGQCKELAVTGILPPGSDQNPWSEDWDDLQMEYSLAKIKPQFYEPPLFSAAASALVFFSWEIASLGIPRDSIQIEEADETAGTLSLSFDYPPAGSDKKTNRCRLTYTMADIESSQRKDLALPDKTDPVLFHAFGEGEHSGGKSALPAAMLFVGEGVVKDFPFYQRFSYGENLILYVLETQIASKARKERPKQDGNGKKTEPKATAAKETDSPKSEPIQPEKTGMAKMAENLLETDQTLGVLRQESFAWAMEVLQRIAAGKKVAGKQRRNFRRLHHQLRHQKERGFSNRLEGEFIARLANLSQQFDVENES